MNLSKFNRVTHRDIGYLIAGMTLIYAISGIALNHKHDWNPNYIIDNRSFKTDATIERESFSEKDAITLLETLDDKIEYKAFHFPDGSRLTIYIQGGVVQVNASTGDVLLQRITKRPLFYQVNFLHYNPGKWWKYFSDLYCVSLILVTITGLFIVKGRNGITRRGAVLTVIGIILPLIFLFIY